MLAKRLFLNRDGWPIDEMDWIQEKGTSRTVMFLGVTIFGRKSGSVMSFRNEAKSELRLKLAVTLKNVTHFSWSKFGPNSQGRTESQFGKNELEVVLNSTSRIFLLKI